MPKGPIRRAQLIAPFGVGAMMVVKDGTSVIATGLDHWYENEILGATGPSIDLSEFIIEEWRLSKLLRVDHFRSPPDYRRKSIRGNVQNSELTIPFHRFPQWHFCPFCKLLAEWPLTASDKIECPECKQKKSRSNNFVQVPFVSLCDNGHIQDFPWREWVHKSKTPTCLEAMRLISTGGASLSAQQVQCACGAKRNLANITNSSPDGSETDLSNLLDTNDEPFLCQGKRPWHGDESKEECNRPLRGSLRSASNVYFSSVRSAIYLPRGEDEAPSELIQLIERVHIYSAIDLLLRAKGAVTPSDLKSMKYIGNEFDRFSDVQISNAIRIIFMSNDAETDQDGGVQEVDFRHQEYLVLREKRDDSQLMIMETSIADYDTAISKYLSRIMLIKKLRETRAFTGFSRVFPDSNYGYDMMVSQLWQNKSPNEDLWLPAYTVFGEGIFIEIKEDLLSAWEKLDPVLRRVMPLMENYNRVQASRNLRNRNISPRLVLLHTLSHMLINQLTFECGYSSASLRERLYVSSSSEHPMSGLLIYTAAGDSEGTLGGLVKMGEMFLLRRFLDA
ncbi:DrmB family protein [Nitrospirota bacterium]